MKEYELTKIVNNIPPESLLKWNESTTTEIVEDIVQEMEKLGYIQASRIPTDKREAVDKLAYGITLVRLAEWIAIEHDKTRLQFEEYMEEAQGLAGLLHIIGYRLSSSELEVLSEEELEVVFSESDLDYHAIPNHRDKIVAQAQLDKDKGVGE